VKLKKVEEKTKSGLIVSSGQNLKRQQYGVEEAIVDSLGPNAFKAFDDGVPWCKVGDLVAIVKYSGKDYEDDKSGEIYRIINDEDVMAIIEE
jgi:co-chaperonin GroES (HSP10)